MSISVYGQDVERILVSAEEIDAMKALCEERREEIAAEYRVANYCAM